MNSFFSFISVSFPRSLSASDEGIRQRLRSGLTKGNKLVLGQRCVFTHVVQVLQ